MIYLPANPGQVRSQLHLFQGKTDEGIACKVHSFTEVADALMKALQLLGWHVILDRWYTYDANRRLLGNVLIHPNTFGISCGSLGTDTTVVSIMINYSVRKKARFRMALGLYDTRNGNGYFIEEVFDKTRSVNFRINKVIASGLFNLCELIPQVVSLVKGWKSIRLDTKEVYYLIIQAFKAGAGKPDLIKNTVATWDKFFADVSNRDRATVMELLRCFSQVRKGLLPMKQVIMMSTVRYLLPDEGYSPL